MQDSGTVARGIPGETGMTLTRRDALKLGGLVAAGVAGVAVPFGATALQAKSISTLPDALFPRRYARPLLRPPVLQPTGPGGTPYVPGEPRYYDITARAGTAELIPGVQTPVGAYNGLVPGPTLSMERGEPAFVTIRNKLPAANPMGGDYSISTHLHGSESLPEFDGYASDVTKVGYKKTYEWPNSQPARTMWYHDHGQHFTAQNAYGGLAAQYHLHDEVERMLLPQGEFDVPLTVTDAIFNANGSLAYRDNDHSGLWGDVVLVNGRAWPRMTVKRRTYRFRILVASISRSYRWRLSNGMPVTVVATDGGLVPDGIEVLSFRHAPAERYEVVIDFSKVPLTTKRVELLNSSNENNIDYDFTGMVMAFDLVDAPFDKSDPTWNRQYAGMHLADCPVMSQQVTGAERVVSLRVKKDLNTWTFGGQTWQDVVDSGFTKVIANPAVGETQIWEIENSSGGWFHPVHLHLVDFKVLTRNGQPAQPQERGPKDVVYVGEEETVRLLVNFDSPHHRGGRYMVHCHNLPHEDHDMMTQFVVGPNNGDGDPHHPVYAAKPVWDND